MTLSVLYEDLGYPQTWSKPFRKLLPLLKIMDCANAEFQQFCFQHTHNLSELSRVFLSVAISPGVTHEIATNSSRFDNPDSSFGQALVAELEEYANRALSRVWVSIFRSNLHQATDIALGETPGLQ